MIKNVSFERDSGVDSNLYIGGNNRGWAGLGMGWWVYVDFC